MLDRLDALAEAFRKQAGACASLGSSQYSHLMAALADNIESGGISRDLLLSAPTDAWREAVPLRLAAAVHRIVLRGDAPTLATRYASAGGDGGPIGPDEFLATAAHYRGEIDAALRETVQTNEVGRCAALRPAFAHASRRCPLPLNMLEIGASAGLLSHWDRYAYIDHANGRSAGDSSSGVRLVDRWSAAVDLDIEQEVAHRAMCDISPLDARRVEDQQRLLSFVWPDQRHRLELLRSALAVAAHYAIAVDAADAGDWLAEQLPNSASGMLTVVFHAIVWQYLPLTTKQVVRSVIEDAGERATRDRPIAWIRMEPAGAVADVRVTEWPGGRESQLLTTSYHGADVRPPLRSDQHLDPTPSDT
ncbi:MAG: DUF2332 domain-containing protein [Ilumatobacteraceae bacterium]